jgi:hypothetical protein
LQLQRMSGEGKDKDIYDQGLIGILRDLHDQIDAAVADAYGWPVDLSDEEILLLVVALNKERAEEEARGLIRWLRPEYQNPTGQQAAKGKTADMDLGVVAKIEKAPWPKTMPEQIAAVREALTEMGEATPEKNRPPLHPRKGRDRRAAYGKPSRAGPSRKGRRWPICRLILNVRWY